MHVRSAEMENSGGIYSTRRLDGGEDAARRYWKWRQRARAYLRLLQARSFPLEALGSAIFCLLDGPAEMALEGITVDDLAAPDGAERVFQYLDARFPDLEAHDKVVSRQMKYLACAWRKVKGQLTQAEVVSCLRKLPDKALRFLRWRVGI